MKKALAILFVFCLMLTSAFSFPAYAEDAASSEGKKAIVLESFFGDGTNWSVRGSDKFFDEDGDGVKEVIRLTSSSTAIIALRSPSFTLIPGDEYELTYYVRVPDTSGEFYTDAANYCPRYAFYQPTETEDGVMVSSNYSQSKNEYAYKDVRRTNFVSTWQVDGYEPYARNRYSVIDHTHFCAASPNEAYKNWTKITMNFTAIDDEAIGAVGNQITALYFTFNSNKAIDGLIYDIKDLTLRNKSVAVPDPETQKTILTSDFGSDTNWTKRGSITYTDENSDGVKDFARLKPLSNAVAALRSAPVQIIPGEEYELTFLARIPEESKDFQTDTYKVYPEFAMYQPTLTEEGTKVTDNHGEGKNEYAYKGNGETTILRRTDFVSTWQIGDFDPIERKRFSSFADSLYATACPGATIDEVYNGWTKVTYKFTGLASAENDGPETVAFYFYVSKNTNAEGCFFDIKDVKLIENPNAAPETPEVPEEPEQPEEPEEPAGPVETPYISVVDTEGNQHFYGADIGAKVDITNNPDGTKTFALTYDTMEGVNTFEGWFDGETLLSTEETYTSTADVNADNVKAKIICRSVISGGLGFESYTENTSLKVEPEKVGTLPYDDRWGVWSIYGKNGHYETDTNTFSRTAYYQYAHPYQSAYDEATGTLVKGERVVVQPYSGNSMFGFDARGRSIVRKLDNLKPNTEYQLSFYSYNLSKWDFLERVTVANTYDLLTKTIVSSETAYTGNVKVYGYYKEPLAESGMRYKIPAIADESKVLNWNKITVNFKTDEDDTELYLHLAASNGYDAASTSHHYIDNLVVCETKTPDSFEDAADFQGAAIRRGDDETPQALRVKFEIPNSITNIYKDNGYSLKEYGALVAYNNQLNGSDLTFDTKNHFKGVAYNIDEDINKVFKTTATGSIVSFALYNIGVKGSSTNYNAYNEEIALRPYSIFVDANGNEKIYYADTAKASVFDVVDAILSQPANSNNLTGYLSDLITARNIVSGAAYDAYVAAGRNNYSQSDSMGGLTLNDLGENLPIHTTLQAEYLNGEYANIANFAGGVDELSRPLPITFSWNDTNSTGTLYGYLLTVSENSDLSNPLVYATANKAIDIYNLKIGTDYYWNVIAIYSDGVVISDVDEFSTEATGPRNLYISGTTNARDLGGWTINGKKTNQGVIFRSSQIDYITVEGRNTLINQLGVKTEIDIRESKEAVNTLPDDLNYYAFHTKSHIFTASKDTIINFFGVLGNKANYPIIYHCKIGTDRTGMMSFLLNSLLGASEEQLYRDYLYSNFGYIGGARDCEVIDGYLEVVNTAEGETFAEKTYNYLVDLGVNAEHINTFIEMMTQ